MIRNRPRTKFVMIRNAAMRDPHLSLKAKGLLGVMLSCPDDWTYYMEWLQDQSKDGRDAHRSAMKELVNARYVIRRRSKGEDGLFNGWQYLVADYRQEEDGSADASPPGHDTPPDQPTAPENNEQDNGSPTDGKPVGRRTGPTEDASDGKPAPTKKDSTKTESTKIQSSRRTHAPAAATELSTTTREEMKNLDDRILHAFGPNLLRELYSENPRRRTTWPTLTSEEQLRVFRDAQQAMTDSANTRSFRTVLKDRLDDATDLIGPTPPDAPHAPTGVEASKARLARQQAATRVSEEAYDDAIAAGLGGDEAGRRATEAYGQALRATLVPNGDSSAFLQEKSSTDLTEREP